jgi:hypothetical protein
MAATAFATLYRDEWIAGYERDESLLRSTVSTDAMISGREAVFLIATSNREAVTRGPNGLIPAANDDLSQVTLTLAEWHDLSQKTRFNIFAGQSDQREILQRMGRKVINRHIDDVIIDALAAGTLEANTTGTTTIMSKSIVNRATTMLWNGNVTPERLFGVITPAAFAYLTDLPSFSSVDYVNEKVLVDPAKRRFHDWMGVTWMVHTGLPGIGTADASCFIYDQNAVGHAIATGDIQAIADYNTEQDYSWARTTVYDGAKLLQNAGVIEIHHDDTALSA